MLNRIILWIGSLLLITHLSHASNFLEITMQNQLDDTDNLYQYDTSSSNRINLIFRNISGGTISVPVPDSTDPSAQNYSVGLSFPAGKLTNNDTNPILVDSSGWTAMMNPETTDVYLINTQAFTIEPNALLTLTLSNIIVNNTLESGVVNPAVVYNNFYNAEDKKKNDTYLLQVHVEKDPYLPFVPFRVGFVDGNSVLNNGNDNDPLLLRITNISSNPLTFKSGENGSSLYFFFDAQQSDDTQDWALAAVDKVAEIIIENENKSNWKSQQDTIEKNPVWKITPQEDLTLKQNQFLDFQVTNVQTTLPAGTTTLYLQAQEIPGYQTSSFTCQIQKVPVLIRADGDNPGSAFIGPQKGEDFAISFIADTTRNIGVIEDGGKSSLIKLNSSVINTNKGVMSGAAHDYEKAQQFMSGGGKVTLTKGSSNTKYYFNWDSRFIAPLLNHDLCADLYVEINPLTADLPASQVYDGQARVFDNTKGLLLKPWEILYAVHTIGGGKDAITYYLDMMDTNNALNTNRAANWLMIAFVNHDNQTVKLGTGTILGLNASTQKGNVLPSGTIVTWSGSKDNLPDGWVLCDGKNGTPDLKNRFVVGAGDNYSVGDTGGQKQVTLIIDQMPKHNHGEKVSPDGSHNHYTEGAGANGLSNRKRHYSGSSNVDIYWHPDENKKDWRGTVDTNNSGSHHHTITNDGSGNSHENRPPYYALCYIMKQ